MGKQRLARYSLIGPEGARAEAAGLAGGRWFRSEVPRKTLKELMRRGDRPAIRDTAIWLGVLALAVSGGVGFWLAATFAFVLAVSWKLAGTRWQMSERAGLVVVLLALPAFYLDWSFQRRGADAASQVYAGVS